MSVIGIDYGNVECVIAQAKRGGIDIILNENSNRKNPAMVCVAGKQRYIGEAAVSMARTQYKNTATDVKRLIGRKYAAKDVQEEIAMYGFKCVELPNGLVGIVLNYNDTPTTFTCEQVVGMFLNKMQSIAAVANDGVNPAYCVLSCPGYFTDMQRRGMLNAAKIAGMNCLRLMNEHTAVALSYGIYKSLRNLFHETEPEHVMFIDIGHSGYTVSVVAFVKGKLQVKSVAYDRFLGGRNFDQVIAKDVAEKFQAKYKKNPLADAKSRIKLLGACEKAKKNLSPQGVNSTTLAVECLVDEIDYNAKLNLEEFETLIAPLLDRLEAPIVKALADAGITKDKLSCVEIVGGGVRVASVKRRLSDILGLDKEKPNMGLSTTLNADEAVARGCALQCAILSPLFKVKDFSIADIVNFPVRVSWEKSATDAAAGDDAGDNDDEATESNSAADGNSVLIFTRKDDFPKVKRITFRRAEEFTIDAAYDDSAIEYLPPSPFQSIGKFTVSGIPNGETDEVPRIRVQVKHDIHGLVEVSSSQMMVEVKEESKEEEAKEGEEGKEAEEKKEEAPKKKKFRKIELKVTPSVGGLSGVEVTKATEEELAMAQQDRVIEETANKRNELETFVYDLRNHLSEKYSDFVAPNDRDDIENKLNEMEDWLYSDEGFDSIKSVYQSKLDSLKQLSAPIDVRHVEHSERPVAVNELKAVIEEYKRLANTTEEIYSHWTDEDRNTLRSTATAIEGWLFEQLNAQAEKSLTDAPVLTAAMIRSKVVELRATGLPIITKPKPLPKVEPPAAPTATEEDTKEGEKMDLD
ncbi:heat shock protein belonging to the HSP70 family [Thraustotheca clavata]|uniref:Heat shock protein belonging to the HSP70 family n=1 Tax=Thraustotheca clavata TaxID=74557 RepID=A0A1W0A1M0_9STRA|nr:heat shock protein belonging to the HSP70 family [Thraustotheca clavata]